MLTKRVTDDSLKCLKHLVPGSEWVLYKYQLNGQVNWASVHFKGIHLLLSEWNIICSEDKSFSSV